MRRSGNQDMPAKAPSLFTDRGARVKGEVGGHQFGAREPGGSDVRAAMGAAAS